MPIYQKKLHTSPLPKKNEEQKNTFSSTVCSVKEKESSFEFPSVLSIINSKQQNTVPLKRNKGHRKNMDDSQRIQKWVELALSGLISETARYDDVFTTLADNSLSQKRKNEIEKKVKNLIRESKARTQSGGTKLKYMNTSAGSIVLHSLQAFGGLISSLTQDNIECFKNNAHDTNKEPSGESETTLQKALTGKTAEVKPDYDYSDSFLGHLWKRLNNDPFPIGPTAADAAPIPRRTVKQAKSELHLVKENKHWLEQRRYNYMDEYHDLIRQYGRETEAYDAEARADRLRPEIEKLTKQEEELEKEINRLQHAHLDKAHRVHIIQSQKLAKLSASALKGRTAEQLQIKILDYLNNRFSNDPEAKEYINELTARSLGQHWAPENYVDDILINDLLSVGFPEADSGLSAQSPAIVYGSIPSSYDYLSSSMLNIISYGQLVGKQPGDTLDTLWGHLEFTKLDEQDYLTADLFPRLGSGIPPSAETIHKALKWAYGKISQEPFDVIDRMITADSRYKELEQTLKPHLAISQTDIERNPNGLRFIETMDRLRGAIAYLAYDFTLFKGVPPNFSPKGGGYVGFVEMKNTVKTLLHDIRSQIEIEKTGIRLEPALLAHAKQLTEGSLSDLIGVSLQSILQPEVKKVADQFPSLLKPDSVIEMSTISYSGRFSANKIKQTFSLSDMILSEVPEDHSWRCVKNCVKNGPIPNTERDKITQAVTRARYDADTEIPFQFQKLMDEKRPELTMVLDSVLQLHAQEFINSPSTPNAQKELVTAFLNDRKYAYKCAYNENTIFGSIFIPSNENDHRHGYHTLTQSGLLYSPYNGFTWIDRSDTKISGIQEKAIKEGLTKEGLEAFKAGKVKPPEPGRHAASTDSYSPMSLFHSRVGGEEIKSSNLSGYLINSFSEYFDHIFSEQHTSLQDEWREIQRKLQQAISILSLAAIPIPQLGLAMAGGNIFISIVTLTDQNSSSSDKKWAIADLVLEPLGAVGDVLILSKSASRSLNKAFKLFGAESTEFKNTLKTLTQQALIEQKGPTNVLVGFINRGSKGKSWSELSSGHLVSKSNTKGSCRGLTFSHAVGKINGQSMDNLPSLFKEGDLQALKDVMDMHDTQRVVSGRDPISMDEAKQATKNAVSKKGAHVAFDSELSYLQTKDEIIAQLGQHDEVAFVIGTQTHAVSLTKGSDGITIFDPSKGIARWPNTDVELRVEDVLDYISKKYKSSLVRSNLDNPLYLTVIEKHPGVPVIHPNSGSSSKQTSCLGETVYGIPNNPSEALPLNIKSYMDELKASDDVNRMINNPLENCENLLHPVSKFMKDKGMTEIQYRGMFIWNDEMDTMPISHFVVKGKMDGETYIFDLSAAQFENIGMPSLNKPLILSEDAWVDTYQKASKTKLIKFKDYDNKGDATRVFGPTQRPSPFEKFEVNGESVNFDVLKQPPWYTSRKMRATQSRLGAAGGRRSGPEDQFGGLDLRETNGEFGNKGETLSDEEITSLEEKLKAMERDRYWDDSHDSPHIVNKRREFGQGISNGDSEEYRFLDNFSFKQKTTMLENGKFENGDNIDMRNRGALFHKVTLELGDIVVQRKLTKAFNWGEEAKKSGGNLIEIIPQGEYLKLSEGVCRPVAMLMAYAIETRNQNNFTKSLKSIGTGNDSLLTLLRKTHGGANVETGVFNTLIKNMQPNMQDTGQTFTFSRLNENDVFPSGINSARIDIPEHSMALTKSGSVYYFFDPNYGIVSFPSFRKIKGYITKHFKSPKYGYPQFEGKVNVVLLNFGADSPLTSMKLNGKTLTEIVSGD